MISMNKLYTSNANFRAIKEAEFLDIFDYIIDEEPIDPEEVYVIQYNQEFKKLRIEFNDKVIEIYKSKENENRFYIIVNDNKAEFTEYFVIEGNDEVNTFALHFLNYIGVKI